MTSAIAALQAQGARLAEQARSDALEIGLMIARRVIEAELRADVGPLLALIKSAVRKAGESRRVRVHLCPEDIEKVELSKVQNEVSMAQLELVSDPELSLGDCLVDTDWGTVDGRLNARLAEIGKTLQPVRLGEVA